MPGPNKIWIYYRSQLRHVRRHQRQIKRFDGGRDLLPAFGLSLWHACRLPIYDLPFTVPFDECSAVSQIRNRLRSGGVSCSDQTKRYDRRVAVLLNANVFGRVDRHGSAGLRRGRVAQVAQYVSLRDATSGRTRVDQIISPEALVNRRIVSRRTRQELVE